MRVAQSVSSRESPWNTIYAELTQVTYIIVIRYVLSFDDTHVTVETSVWRLEGIWPGSEDDFNATANSIEDAHPLGSSILPRQYFNASADEAKFLGIL